MLKAVAFTLLLSSTFGLEGRLLLQRVFDGKLVTESIFFPPSHEGYVSEQRLQGPLAGLSLTCGSCPPDSLTRLAFQTETGRALVVLADEAVSVIQMKEKAEVTQVIPLHKHCVPTTLLAFQHSPTSFAILCAHHSLHLASIRANFSVTLSDIREYTTHDEVDHAAIFIASGNLMRVITYLGENVIELYTINDATTQIIDLPPNVNCSEPELHPLHTREAFLLYCATGNGAILYIVPASGKPVVDVRSIQADGRPFSSLDGAYILTVNENRVTVYASDDVSIPGTLKELQSPITSVVNLDADNVQILTESGEHAVLNLNGSLSELRYMPGGTPLLSEWVDSSNYYFYLTVDEGIHTIYTVDLSSMQPEYPAKQIANKPEMVVFLAEKVPKHRATEDTPKPTMGPVSPVSLDDTVVSTVVGSVVGTVMVFGGFVVVAMLLVFAWGRYNNPPKPNTSSSSELPLQESGGRGVTPDRHPPAMHSAVNPAFETGSNGPSSEHNPSSPPSSPPELLPPQEDHDSDNNPHRRFEERVPSSPDPPSDTGNRDRDTAPLQDQGCPEGMSHASSLSTITVPLHPPPLPVSKSEPHSELRPHPKSQPHSELRPHPKSQSHSELRLHPKSQSHSELQPNSELLPHSESQPQDPSNVQALPTRVTASTHESRHELPSHETASASCSDFQLEPKQAQHLPDEQTQLVGCTHP
jgi:hypothetical protein